VAMSGGIDSSLSMILLKKEGYEPIGVTFKLVEGSRCCDLEAVSHAKEVCKRYGISHHVIDVSKEFKKNVINYYLSELKCGRTPNPCVICNRFLKFDQLFKVAKKFGAKYVATGHYAQIRLNKLTGFYELMKSRDTMKDQSYYLCFLKQSWLGRIIFPVGGYKKEKIYEFAKKEGLNFLVQKKQSQDLCFVDNKLKNQFVLKNIKGRNGNIVDKGGNVLGQHSGISNFTIGQRKGLYIASGPYFVIDIDTKRNNVIVSKDPEDENLYCNIVKLKKVNFITWKPKKNIRVMAKIRYQQPLSRAILEIHKPEFRDDELDNKCVQLKFNKPQRAVTKGQIAVFYRGRKCLGGGIIR